MLWIIGVSSVWVFSVLCTSSPSWGVEQSIQKYLGLKTKKKLKLFGFVVIESSYNTAFIKIKQFERN